MFLLLEKFRNLGELPRILILANELREHFVYRLPWTSFWISLLFSWIFNIWGYKETKNQIRALLLMCVWHYFLTFLILNMSKICVRNLTLVKNLEKLIFFVFKTSRFAFKNVRPTRAAKLTPPLIFGIFITFFSIQPGYNKPLYNDVLGKRNDFLCPSNSKINETKPRYNETSLQQKNFASLLRLAIHFHCTFVF